MSCLCSRFPRNLNDGSIRVKGTTLGPVVTATGWATPVVSWRKLSGSGYATRSGGKDGYAA